MTTTVRLLAVCAIALAFGFVGSVPVTGPVALMVLSRAADKKFAEALRVGVGAAVADGIYAGIAFWGFTTIFARHPWVVPVSHAATGIVLVGLGIRFAFWSPTQQGESQPGWAGTALVGFSISAVNPTLLLTWSAAVAFVYSKGLGPQPSIVAIPFGVCAASGVAGWIVCFVPLLRVYGGKLPRTGMTWVVRATGLTLIGLGVWSGVELARWAAKAALTAGFLFSRADPRR
jgi:threonine/homoserine/homoserine lactone efflux protein